MDNSPKIRLLILADIHHAPDELLASDGSAEFPCISGCELSRRAIEDAKNRGGFDYIILPGDLLNDGTAANAEQLLMELKEQIISAAPDTPILVVPGNHDGDPERLLAIFKNEPGLHEVSISGCVSYRIVTFADHYTEDNYCTRSSRDREFLLRLAEREGPPIIVIQHGCIYPHIESDYPFRLTNSEQLMQDYAQAGVLLSISGHYHVGQPMSIAGGVRYFTASALCSAPFQYTIVTLSGENVAIEQYRLMISEELL